MQLEPAPAQVSAPRTPISLADLARHDSDSGESAQTAGQRASYGSVGTATLAPARMPPPSPSQQGSIGPTRREHRPPPSATGHLPRQSPPRPPNVVLGRIVGNTAKDGERASPDSTYSNTELGSAGGRCQFAIALYVDDIRATTPAIIVWKFRKSAEVRLDRLSPIFKATRGFYGVLNTACTANHRPYYALNVVRFASKERVKGAAVPTVRLTFHGHYDDDGVIRSRFDLIVNAVHNGSDVVTSLGLMQLTTHGSHVFLGERDLAAEGTRSRSLPSLMFTPAIFQNIARPEQSCLSWGTSRRLVDQVWARLSEMNASDWERYTIAKNRFATEYARYMRGAMWTEPGA